MLKPSGSVRFISLLVLLLVALPLAAGAIVEEKTETSYPDEVTLDMGGKQVPLKVTGVALREKTFLKVDVYTIVSYMDASEQLAGDDKGQALLEAKICKRIQMDLLRGFSKDKLVNSFKDVIEDNYDDTSAFDTDMDTFFTYFVRDAEENDLILFDYCPTGGLVTSLNGEVKGTITNFDFVQALWTVWFGEECASDDMKEALLGAL